MQARWQNPQTASFLSVGRVVPGAWDPQIYNASAHARNNPANTVDPDGMSPVGKAAD
jgi:hypothetical protein